MQSEQTVGLYLFFDSFLKLLSHESSYVRTRGYRLVCAQARWDCKGKIENNLDILLGVLNDEKLTAVRQCLAALHTVVRYKPELGK